MNMLIELRIMSFSVSAARMFKALQLCQVPSSVLKRNYSRECLTKTKVSLLKQSLALEYGLIFIAYLQ